MNKKIYLIALFVGIIGLGIAYREWPENLLAMANSQHQQHEDHHQHDGKEEAEHQEGVAISDQQIADTGMKIQEAGPGELTIMLQRRGKVILHPDRVAHVLSPVSAVAKEVAKQLGETVVQGELLAVMESREMAEMRANYLTAAEKEALASSVFKREENLFKKKISSEQDYMNARSALMDAKINLQLTKQKVEGFSHFLPNNEISNLSTFEIRAPLAGIVLHRDLVQGEHVESMAKIFEIADPSIVWIEIGVFPRDLLNIKEGQAVTVVMPVEQEVTSQAKVVRVIPIIQDERITTNVIAELENPQCKWCPGALVQANIAIEQAGVAVRIPKEALLEIDGKETVFIREGERFLPRVVKTGRRDNLYVEILDGIQPGEKFAASQVFLLKAELAKESGE